MGKGRKKSNRPAGTQPNPVDINQLVAMYQRAAYADGEAATRLLLKAHPHFAFGWKLHGLFLRQLGQLQAALTAMQHAVRLAPDDAESHSNLGVICKGLGDARGAEQSYRQAIQLDHRMASAWNNLGNLLRDRGELAEAQTSTQRAIDIEPGFAEAYNSLGNIHKDRSNFVEAEKNYRKAVELQGGFVPGWMNLAFVLFRQNRTNEAQQACLRALELEPNLRDAMQNLVVLSMMQGQPEAALDWAMQLLQRNESPEIHALFAMSLRRIRQPQYRPDVAAATTRALQEPWCRPLDLAPVAARLLSQQPAVRHCIDAVQSVWPAHLHLRDLLQGSAWLQLASCDLLHAVLVTAPVCDTEVERLLTVLRAEFLHGLATGNLLAAGANVLALQANLAKQCFINEYVFLVTEGEWKIVQLLLSEVEAALAAGRPIAESALLVLAMYAPLNGLTAADRLAEMAWSAPVEEVLLMQLHEPALERAGAVEIPRLTDIAGGVSQAVMAQYEESPYPRWIKPEPVLQAMPVAQYLQENFPAFDAPAFGDVRSPRLLVAGCGTGQHPLESARKFAGVQVLAVDLSLTSLSYARRKTRELGITNIAYAQADILGLGTLGQQFDVIESVGVLHHMEQPFAGWKVLLGLLRPGGIMRLGLYSAVARKGIAAARKYIADRGYQPSPQDIRHCRQELVDNPGEFGFAVHTADFFSMSNCRDLLFHVQEHCHTLIEIDAFLKQEKLQFLGFSLEPEKINAFKKEFPKEPQLLDLICWNEFEKNHPGTFYGMYQFWVQK